MISRRLSALALLLLLFLGASPLHAATTPDTLSYEGRLLDTSGDPVTTAIVLRFSLWKSADWTSGDASGGSINTGAANYGGWKEAQTLTPNSNGNFQVQLGSSVALPTIDFNQHKYLQVEVKASGDPDTSYVLLDPTGDDGADTVDRKTISSVAYAKNAESVSNKTVGTASGNLLILGPEGRVKAAQMGSGTTTLNFDINADNAAGDATLTFGNTLQTQTLTFSANNQRFEFSTDVYIAGDLTVTGTINNGKMASAELTMHPPFTGASTSADGTNNIGQLAIAYDADAHKNFYLWTSTQSALQDYDVVLPITLSTAFTGWGTTPLTIAYRSTSASAADNALDITVLDTAGQPVTLGGSASGLASTSWTTTGLTFTGSPTWTAGGTMFIKFKVSAKNNAQIHLGAVKLSF